MIVLPLLVTSRNFRSTLLLFLVPRIDSVRSRVRVTYQASPKRVLEGIEVRHHDSGLARTHEKMKMGEAKTSM